MKKHMRFSLLVRFVLRAAEIAAKPGMLEEITRVHSDMLAPVADAFCQAHQAVDFAESAVAAKKAAVDGVVIEFDPVYRAVRWVVVAFVPTTKLPDTLKAQRTDTDIRIAMTTLVSIIQSHAGNAWADDLMTGRFGTFVAKTKTALDELLAATDALAAARKQRADAYMPAYKGYLVFKHLIRDALGPSSPEYRRLHPRASVVKQLEPAEGEPAEGESAEEAAPDSGVMAASPAAAAPADGSPKKVA